ncbi:MAG: hypothetical protein FJX52_14075 [Alphaproteobacteria bacterium]|nr:hypothetical protein [Alphaproteobacteria bacterium]
MADGRRFWTIFGTAAAAWIMVGGLYGALTWSDALARVNGEFEAARRDCVARYPTPERRKRCIDLHEIVRSGNRNQILFERVLIAFGPPAAGLAVWLFIRIYRRLR